MWNRNFIVLNDGKKVFDCLHVGTLGKDWWIYLPKETQYDDGNRERDERHAVANGVTHFDGGEEVSLQRKVKKTENESSGVTINLTTTQP